MRMLQTMGDIDDAPVPLEALVTACVAEIPIDKQSTKRDLRRQHVMQAIDALAAEGLLAFENGFVRAF
jgi:hypothetical protein